MRGEVATPSENHGLLYSLSLKIMGVDFTLVMPKRGIPRTSLATFEEIVLIGTKAEGMCQNYYAH